MGQRGRKRALTIAKGQEATGYRPGHWEVSGLGARGLGTAWQRRRGQCGPGHRAERPRWGALGRGPPLRPRAAHPPEWPGSPRIRVREPKCGQQRGAGAPPPRYLRARYRGLRVTRGQRLQAPKGSAKLARGDDVGARAPRSRDVRGQWRRRRWNPGRQRPRGGGALRLGVRGRGRQRRPRPRRRSPSWTAEPCFVASGRPGECRLCPGSDSSRLWEALRAAASPSAKWEHVQTREGLSGGSSGGRSSLQTSQRPGKVDVPRIAAAAASPWASGGASVPQFARLWPGHKTSTCLRIR